MYLQEIVEVAIGLIFAWLLLSIAILQIQEVIVSYTGKRAKDLEKALGNMLGEKKDEFYKHPLIKGLMEKDGKLPSYIPSRNFAQAIFDIVSKAGTTDSPIRSKLNELHGSLDKLKGGDKEEAKALIDKIYKLGQTAARSQTGSDFQKGIKTELMDQVNHLGKIYPKSSKITGELVDVINNSQYDLSGFFRSEQLLDQVRAGAVALGKNDLGRSIDSLLLGVEEYATNADKALALGRKNIEDWFDNTMERMSGWYKRWAQIWAFVIALGVAGIFNIDSIHIAQELWNKPTLRQASTAYIDTFVQQNSQDGELSKTDLDTLNSDLQEFNYPIGWDEVNKEENKNSWQFWLSKVIGWLITAGAAMQGAPFWFDTLKKLVNVRSTGINPSEKSKENTSDKER